jgi:MFS family permease
MLDDLSRSRLLVLTSALVFVDTLFFSVLAPLLPSYFSSYDLSEAEAGLLSSSYALGTLLAALPAGVLVWRIGPRTAVQLGLAVLAAATLVFAWGDAFALIDAARLVQGAAGALVFSGALTWVINGFPPDRRGAAIGTAAGAGVIGALIGPLFGGIAASLGVGVTFTGMVGIIGLLAIATFTTPELHTAELQPLRSVLKVLRRPQILEGVTLLLVPGICFGVLGVIAPLRIDSLGGGAAIIAGVYTASAIIEGGLSPIVGRKSDSIGRRRPYFAGVTVTAIAVTGFAAAPSLVTVVIALVASALGAGLSVSPGFALLSDGVLALSVHQAFAVGLANMAWAGGQAIGGLGGGALAELSGYTLPLVGVIGMLVMILIWTYRPLVDGSPTSIPCRERGC